LNQRNAKKENIQPLKTPFFASKIPQNTIFDLKNTILTTKTPFLTSKTPF
jgi:hypothetical protein